MDSTLLDELWGCARGLKRAVQVLEQAVATDKFDEVGAAIEEHDLVGYAHAVCVFAYAVHNNAAKLALDTTQRGEVREIFGLAHTHFGHLLGIAEVCDAAVAEPPSLSRTEINDQYVFCLGRALGAVFTRERDYYTRRAEDLHKRLSFDGPYSRYQFPTPSHHFWGNPGVVAGAGTRSHEVSDETPKIKALENRIDLALEVLSSARSSAAKSPSHHGTIFSGSMLPSSSGSRKRSSPSADSDRPSKRRSLSSRRGPASSGTPTPNPLGSAGSETANADDGAAAAGSQDIDAASRDSSATPDLVPPPWEPTLPDYGKQWQDRHRTFLHTLEENPDPTQDEATAEWLIERSEWLLEVGGRLKKAKKAAREHKEITNDKLLKDAGQELVWKEEEKILEATGLWARADRERAKVEAAILGDGPDRNRLMAVMATWMERKRDTEAIMKNLANKRRRGQKMVAAYAKDPDKLRRTFVPRRDTLGFDTLEEAEEAVQTVARTHEMLVMSHEFRGRSHIGYLKEERMVRGYRVGVV